MTYKLNQIQIIECSLFINNPEMIENFIILSILIFLQLLLGVIYVPN